MLLDHSKSATTIQEEKVLKLESKVLMSPVVINREENKGGYLKIIISQEKSL